MENLQYLVLAPGEEPEVRTGPLGYSDMTAIVGYPLEVINLIEPSATMYVCEEAKQQGQEMNESASRLASHNLREGDYVAGTALVVGPLAAGGKDTSLSDEHVARMLTVMAPEMVE